MLKAQSRQVQPAQSLRRHLRHAGRDSQFCRLRIASAIDVWLGHSSLETTLRYLRVADLRSDRIRLQVDNTVAKCIRGGGRRRSREGSVTD